MSETQQPFTAPQAPPPPAKRGNGFGVASLIIGIVALIGAFFPIFNYAAIGLAVIGIVLGVIGLIAKFRSRGTSITGVILSGLALILSIIMAIVYTAIFFGIAKTVEDQKKAASTPHAVVYTIDGDSTDATVTYATFSAGKSGTEQATAQKLPFSKTITAKGDGAHLSFNLFTLTGTNGSTGTTISCIITVDGKSIAHQTSTGPYATTTCTGSN